MTPPTGSALPPGLTHRPLTVADTPAVIALVNAQEVADVGRAETEEADLVAEWQAPGYDPSGQTVGVFDGDRLVAYAELWHAERGDAAVLPEHRGRGIGTWLAAWMRTRARATGRSIVGVPVPEGSAGDRLLAALGYHVRWTSWFLTMPADRELSDPVVPGGYRLREATTDEHPQVHRVVDDAFREWSDRPPTPYDEFAAVTIERPGFEPWNVQVAVDASGAVVGAVHVSLFDGWSDHPAEGVVHRLAVRRDQRGLGLGRALLVHAVREARARGAVTASLATDTRTGALGLYRAAGMEVASTWVHRAVHL